MATRRRFMREFKLDILRQIEHRSVAEVCREHDLHPNQVSKWKREYQQYSKKAFQGNGKMFKLEAQLAEAQRLIGQLYAEKELLKKAIAAKKKREEEERMLRSTR